MLKERTLDFIKKQIIDINDFTYTTDEDEEFFYIEFTQILGQDKNIEFTFKLIEDTLFFHSISYGWKPVEKGSNNKFFWIDLLTH